jgi:hypothetical protein
MGVLYALSLEKKLKSRYVVLLEKVTEDHQKTQINNPGADKKHKVYEHCHNIRFEKLVS